ncbi:hypothetical protein AB0O07_21590 [Streptomyces sp. NPDC093085]|uniref:hypothetical protein n=1 Tax=Streptomyces sp. NPDC093085 TaxID=3155068 RepID=UPI00341EEDA9
MLPPEPPEPADTPTALVECVICRAPGRAEALVDGECRACREGRGTSASVPGRAALPPELVRALAAEARAAARVPTPHR